MGFLGDQSAVVYRDSKTQGVPASGPHEPYKPDIRGLFYFLDGALAELLAAFVADQAVVVYAARSSLNGNLAPADRTLGLVYNDGANNGLYIKSGAAGSGSWNSTGLMLQGQKGDAATLAIGTVTNGTAPSVTNSGTTTAAILDFVLQKGLDGKSFLQTAIDSGYVPAGTTEAQLTTKIVGQISAAAAASATTAAQEAVRAKNERIASESAATRSNADAVIADTARQGVQNLVGNIPSNGILYLPAVSRAVMKGYTGLAVGQSYYLSAPGLEGWFRVIDYAANSAAVVADTYEALRFRSTAMPQFAFERIPILPGLPGGGEYSLLWWEVTHNSAGDDGPRVQSALSLLPEGATLRVPVMVSLKSGPIQRNKGITMRGIGRNSGFNWTGALTANGTTMLQFRADNTFLYDFHVSGMRTTVSQGGANGILWSKVGVDEIGQSLVPLSGFRAEGITMDNISSPITLLGNAYAIPGFAAQPIVPAKNAVVTGCYFEFDYIAVVPFFCDDSRIVGNVFRAIPGPDRSFDATTRILGSERVVWDNVVFGIGTNSNDMAGVYLAGASYDGKRRLNRDVTVRGQIHNVGTGILVNECLGTLDIDVMIRNSYSNIDSNIAIDMRAAPGSVPSQVDNAMLRVRAHGFAQPLYFSGNVKSFTLYDFDFVANSRRSGDRAQYSVSLSRREFSGKTIGTIRNGSFIAPQQNGGIAFLDTELGEFFTIDSVFLPEMDGAVENVGMTGAGKAITSINGPVQDSAAVTLAPGSTRRVPLGTWSARTGLPNPAVNA